MTTETTPHLAAPNDAPTAPTTAAAHVTVSANASEKTSLQGLRAEMADVRRLGYAVDREKNEPGLGCVAAPVRDHTGTIKYGVSISTLLIEHTLEQIEAVASMAVETADKISTALGHRA